MLGPIFHLEMLLGGRRGRQYGLRWFVGGLLLLQLIFFYTSYKSAVAAGLTSTGLTPTNATSEFAVGFVNWVLNQQFLIILLATPVFTAGAVTDEKTRGTLLYLFAADLTAWEILIGKLLGRSYEVFVLLLATMPFLCFIGVYAGMTPVSLLAVGLGLLGPLFAIGAASLLMSVWCRQTRDAVVGLFAIGGFLFLIWFGLTTLGGLGPAFGGLKRLTNYFDPKHVALPAMSGADAREIFAHLIGSWIAWGTVGLACFAVAVWRLRGAYMRQLEHSKSRTIGEWIIPERAPINDQPLLWKERHVDGIAPLAAFRTIPRWLALPTIMVVTVLLVLSLLSLICAAPFSDVAKWIFTLDQTAMETGLLDKEAAFFLLGGIVLVLACLVVGIRCSGTVSGEREKQTWEALLLTPLANQQLIRNKLWGILGAAVPYVLAYMVPALTLAAIVGPPQGWLLLGVVGGVCTILVVVFRKRVDSFITFWVFLVIALLTMVAALLLGALPLFLTLLTSVVTTVAMFYMGGAGIWCSTRFSTSWRSLLATLGLGYLGGLVLWAATAPITAIIGIILWMLFMALGEADKLLGTNVARTIASFTGWKVVAVIASCIVLAGVFLGVPWWFIKNSEWRVGFLERVRVWREEFVMKRQRRRVRRLKGEPA